MRGRRNRRATRPIMVGAALLVAAGCGNDGPSTSAPTPSKVAFAPSVDDAAPSQPVDDRTVASPADSEPELLLVKGVVTSAVDGSPLAAAVVTAGDEQVMTDDDGRFAIEVPPNIAITAARPAWTPTAVTVDAAALADNPQLRLKLEPFTVRGLRVAADVAADAAQFDELLDMAEASVINTLVFDTKDEDDRVLYRSEVELANTMGAVEPLYDPAELLARTRDRGLYAVTRIVTFEDRLWAESVPEAKLALDWVDAGNRDNWEYPLALADEACRLGFDEIQFDYVRYPDGRSAEVARASGGIPATTEERAGVIGSFLAEARSRLAPAGCAVSAAIFGVVMSSPGDEGIGQTVEAVSASVDAVSPMIYPSHYGPGWIGLEDPNEHPGPVVAHSLDGGMPRLAPNTLMRPWLQAFFYREDQVKAQINEVEQRGGGWILWNFYGRYNQDWLPTEGEQ